MSESSKRMMNEPKIIKTNESSRITMTVG